MRLVLLSDTHGRHNDVTVPNGDVLCHAGDLTMQGSVHELKEAAAWLRSLSHKRKVVTGGNHDWGLQHFMDEGREDLVHKMFDGCDYLRDSSVNIEGFNFYGSPWQPWFYDWAFNLPRGGPIMDKWEMIHHSTDVLITHGPPMGILDGVGWKPEHVGCHDLMTRVREVKPKVHLFGHIHCAYGHVSQNGTEFYNASICNEQYSPVNKPFVIDLER